MQKRVFFNNSGLISRINGVLVFENRQKMLRHYGVSERDILETPVFGSFSRKQYSPIQTREALKDVRKKALDRGAQAIYGVKVRCGKYAVTATAVEII